MSTFAVFEDEDFGCKTRAGTHGDSEVRRFGTVLVDNNHETIHKKAAGLIANSFSVEKPDSRCEGFEHSFCSSDNEVAPDFLNNSAPCPSPCSLDEGNDTCSSTKLLLSSNGYFEEIGSYLLQMETKFQCKPNYMTRQRDLSHPMRSVLVDWLVEITDEYKLQRRTLFLAVALMDRFLSEMSVLRSKLQLLGATCMFIAAKFEEIYPPEAAEFAYLTEDTYSVSQILRLERLVLRVVDYQLGFPTVDVMCDRLIAATHLSQEQSTLISYLSELSLFHGDPFLQYTPSVIASACVCLSNLCLGTDDTNCWPQEFELITGKKVTEFYYCLVLLSDVMHQAPSNSNCKSIVARYQTVVACLPDRDRIASLSTFSAFSRDTFCLPKP